MRCDTHLVKKVTNIDSEISSVHLSALGSVSCCVLVVLQAKGGGVLTATISVHMIVHNT